MAGISATDLEKVREIVAARRSLPAIIVQGLIERLDYLAETPCPVCGVVRGLDGKGHAGG